MKYLITGGAGFIGSHLTDALAGDHELVLIDNLASGRVENIRGLIESGAVTFIRGSIIDSALLRDLMEGVDGVFHQAALVSVLRSVRDPISTNEANVSGTLEVLVAARETGVRAVVFASSSSVYGDTPLLPQHEDMLPVPKSPYAVSKLTGEHYMRVFSELYGIRTVSLRYFNVFGPRQDPDSPYAAVIPRFITRILRGEPLVVHGDGSQTRDFTYVKDVVQGNLKAMESGAGGVYNLACGERNSILDLARTVMAIVGREVPVLHQKPRPGDIQDSFADISSARERLKYAPEYNLRTGLEETVSWYRTNRNRT